MKKLIEYKLRKLLSREKSPQFSWTIFFRSERRNLRHFFHKRKWRILGLATGLSVLAAVVISTDITLHDRYLPGVSIGGVDLSYLTQEQAENKLQKKISKFELQKWQLRLGEEEKEFFPWEIGLRFQLDSDLARAFAIGHSGQPLSDLQTRILHLTRQQSATLQMTHQIEESTLREKLADSFSDLRATDYQNLVYVTRNKQIRLKQQSNNYQTADIENTKSQILALAQTWSSGVIELTTLDNDLNLDKGDIAALQDQYNQYRGQKVTLYYRMDHRMNTWDLYARKGNLDLFSIYPNECDDDSDCPALALRLDQSKIAQYLQENISPLTNTETQSAEISYAEGETPEHCLAKPSECQLEIVGFARNGEELDLEKGSQLILMAFEKDLESVALPIRVTPAEVEGLPELGLISLLTTGWSDATTHSSRKRIHNVKNGLSKFDGMIIPTQKKTSFNKQLGDVNGRTGYVKESVIRGDVTIPEYGGGLCQVSSTFYRAAMNAGLQIPQRRNHRYALDYYTPVGTDATIYLPLPDISVLNDTPAMILVQTTMKDDRFPMVNLYGTSDDRSVTYDGPYIKNKKRPPKPQYVKTTNLPVGKTKQVEWAAQGLEATFYRTITYSDGKQKKETIKSKYKAWPDRYLIGAPAEEVTETTLYTVK